MEFAVGEKELRKFWLGKAEIPSAKIGRDNHNPVCRVRDERTPSASLLVRGNFCHGQFRQRSYLYQL
jgi:hypothetical protein